MNLKQENRGGKRICVLLLVAALMIATFAPTSYGFYAQALDEMPGEQEDLETEMEGANEESRPEPDHVPQSEVTEAVTGNEPPDRAEEAEDNEVAAEEVATEKETAEDKDTEEKELDEEELVEAEFDQVDPQFATFAVIDPAAESRFTVAYDGLGGAGQSFEQGLAAGRQYRIKGSEETGISHPLLTLAGWNTQADDPTVLYVPGEVIELTDHLVLYARWELAETPSLRARSFGLLRQDVQRVSVTYHSNSNIPAVVDYAISGADYSVFSVSDSRVAAFQIEGYSLYGWNTSSDYRGDTFVSPQQIENLTEDIILYAMWRPREEVNYSVHYDGEATNIGMGLYSDDYLTYGQTYFIKKPFDINIEAKNPQIYSFTGWNTAYDGQGSHYMPEDKISITEDLRLIAQWQYHSLKNGIYVLDGNGGVFADTQKQIQYLPLDEGFFVADGAAYTLTKEHYTFTGFRCDGNFYGIGEIIPNQEARFYFLTAVWEYSGSYYQVSYQANGEDCFGELPVDEKKYRFGEEAIVKDVSADFGRVGYRFQGWSENPAALASDALITPGTPLLVEKDVTLHAIWRKDNTSYHVTYDGNEQTSGTPPEDTTPYQYNQLVYVKDHHDLHKNGYEFKGWTLVPNSSETPMLPGASFRITESTILYAAWRDYEGERIGVIYYPNSGVGDPYTDGELIPGETYTFRRSDEAQISKENFLLDSWNTEFDGSGNTYYPEESANLQTGLVLYAQWRYDGEPKYSLTYYPGSGRGYHYVAGLEFEDTEELIDPADYNIMKNYHEFAGWDTAKDGTGTRYLTGNEITVTGDVKLYAQWRYEGAEYFSVTYDNQMGQYVVDDMLNPGGEYTIKKPEEVGFVTENSLVVVKYWADRLTDKIYYPDETIPLDRSYILKAVWGIAD